MIPFFTDPFLFEDNRFAKIFFPHKLFGQKRARIGISFNMSRTFYWLILLQLLTKRSFTPLVLCADLRQRLMSSSSVIDFVSSSSIVHDETSNQSIEIPDPPVLSATQISMSDHPSVSSPSDDDANDEEADTLPRNMTFDWLDEQMRAGVDLHQLLRRVFTWPTDWSPSIGSLRDSDGSFPTCSRTTTPGAIPDTRWCCRTDSTI